MKEWGLVVVLPPGCISSSLGMSSGFRVVVLGTVVVSGGPLVVKVAAAHQTPPTHL